VAAGKFPHPIRDLQTPCGQPDLASRRILDHDGLQHGLSVPRAWAEFLLRRFHMTFEEQAPRPLHELAVALSRSRPAFVPTAQSFPPLDADEIAEDLNLYVRAAAAGQHGDPPPGASGPDRLETEIAAAIQERLRETASAYETLQAQCETRVQEACITAEERRRIGNTVGSALAELEANAQYVRDWLQEMWRETVGPVEAEFEDFRARHGLRRDPKLPSRGERWFRKFVILAILVVGTALTQGAYTAGRGRAWDLLAAAWVLFDVGVAVWFARRGLPALARKGFGSKLRGVVATVFFFGSLIAVNLLAVHCRELLAAGDEVTFAELRRRLTVAPFALDATRSWLVAALGCGMSLAAVRVAAGLEDVYPRYGALGRRLVAVIEAHEGEKESCARALAGMRNTTLADLEAPIEVLRERELEAHEAAEARAALHRSWVEYLDHVGRVHAGLCKRYRDINRVVRQVDPPASFDRDVPRPRFLHPPELEAAPGAPGDGWVEVLQWLENQRESLAASTSVGLAPASDGPSRVAGAPAEPVGAGA
jgi:hypothetical protein